MEFGSEQEEVGVDIACGCFLFLFSSKGLFFLGSFVYLKKMSDG